MKSNIKVSRAIAAILSAHAAQAAQSVYAAESPSEATGGLQEVIVTANRREENVQNVPITIQALTAETISQLNVTTFDDYVKFLPNVTMSGAGPGQSQIYMRGLATTQDSGQSSGAAGSFPNVAVYLDEQTAQLPGRNLDIYAADLERIEVLEGPQGTLFGAGAQAGVIRYITNKPKLNKFEANANAGYAATAHGDPSNNLDAMINLPLIPDTLAVRAVVYNESRGGYINNIPGSFSRAGTDVGIAYLFCGDGKHPYYSTCLKGGNSVKTPGVVPPNSTTINNDKTFGSSINPVVYKGFRVSGLYQFNEDWNVLVAESYQHMQADGVFAETVTTSDGGTLPDLSVQMYNPAWDKDWFTNTALTLTGRLGMLKAIYTGGYLVRNVEQVGDYTNYTRGKYADYYSCRNRASAYYTAQPNPSFPGQCFSPSSSWRTIQKNTHQSHELRLSTPDDLRIRAIGGVYWEDFKLHDQSDWFYRAAEAGFSPLQPVQNATLNNPNVRPATDAFYDDITRGYKQLAGFASLDFELIPKTLTLTAGTRYYQMDTFEVGVKQGSYGCRPGGLYAKKSTPATTAIPCVGGLNLDTYNISDDIGMKDANGKPVHLPNNVVAPEFSDSANGLQKRYSGFKSRVNLSWKVTGDALLYATWSQGFRPGGYNRGTGVISATSPLFGIFNIPIGFKPDVLTNNEIGWKTLWLDHRLQFNGAVYQEDWKDVQITIFDPGVTSNLTFTTNGPNYRVRGVETNLVARVTNSLTVAAGASWNSSELVNTPTFTDKSGKPIDFATLGIPNPYGTKGDPLAQSPPFQANLRVRYEFLLNDCNVFWQVAGTHRSHSYASTDKLSRDLQGNSIAYDQAAFTTVDGAIGVGKDRWNLQLYGQNLTDKRADLFSNYQQWVKATTINRPRTIGLRFGYRFGGE